MDSKKSNKIREIVKLQQILKKWKKVATASSTTAVAAATASTTSNKGIKFLKKTLSLTDVSSSDGVVPKGFLAVCVGKELKRFIIRMEHLSHPAFQVLLREAEEEFGFHQEGVLKIPCQVSLFEKILKVVEDKKPVFFGEDKDAFSYYASDCEVTPTHHAQTCR